MQKTVIVVSITLVLICSAMSCKYVMPERYVDYNKGRVPVNLPSAFKNGDIDRGIEKDNAVIITVTADGRMYLGTDHTPIEDRDLGARMKPLLAQQPEDDRIVYMAGDLAADYGHVVSACDEIRRAEQTRVGLLVNGLRDDWPSRLIVELPKEPDPNEDLSNLRPNPLTLVAAIKPDLDLTLNLDPMGSVNDLDPLSQKLQQIFQLREEQYALKPGYETRTDLPMSERVERTLIIKAPKHVKYGDVAKVIDAARGAGARPIVLQLDDLPN